MSKTRRQGFILTYIIVLLGLVGVVMFVLTGGANTMLFEADAAYVQAADRNLTASALAWARHRSSGSEPVVLDEPIALDTSSLAVRDANVSVRLVKHGDAALGCHIETSVAKGQQSLNNSREYVLPAR